MVGRVTGTHRCPGSCQREPAPWLSSSPRSPKGRAGPWSPPRRQGSLGERVAHASVHLGSPAAPAGPRGLSAVMRPEPHSPHCSPPPSSGRAPTPGSAPTHQTGVTCPLPRRLLEHPLAAGFAPCEPPRLRGWPRGGGWGSRRTCVHALLLVTDSRALSRGAGQHCTLPGHGGEGKASWRKCVCRQPKERWRGCVAGRGNGTHRGPGRRRVPHWGTPGCSV